MTELFSFNRQTNLNGFTLIIPTISVGNVPQLTVDLLITTLGLKKVATLWHPAITPSVGADPYELNGPEVCTACELYANENLRLAAIQLRSTLCFKLTTKFLSDLKQILLEFKLKDVVILASSFDYELHVIDTNKFYYASNCDAGGLMDRIGVKRKEVEANGMYFIHGSGFAVKLYEVLQDKFECILLIKYVSEGDNRPDAIGCLQVLGKVISNLKDCDCRSVKFPSSWSCLFGGPPPLGMF